jgi:ribosome-binding protein aMBF1 (putative translation factor)
MRVQEAQNMTAKRERTYSRYTKDAAVLMGKNIQLARKERKMSERDFADRIGISPTTLRKIERGDLKCEIGIVFEAAALLGVKLFEVDSRQSFSPHLERVNDKLALLPKSIRRPPGVDDAF